MEFEKRKCNTVLLLQDDNSDGKRKYVAIAITASRNGKYFTFTLERLKCHEKAEYILNL